MHSIRKTSYNKTQLNEDSISLIQNSISNIGDEDWEMMVVLTNGPNLSKIDLYHCIVDPHTNINSLPFTFQLNNKIATIIPKTLTIFSDQPKNQQRLELVKNKDINCYNIESSLKEKLLIVCFNSSTMSSEKDRSNELKEKKAKIQKRKIVEQEKDLNEERNRNVEQEKELDDEKDRNAVQEIKMNRLLKEKDRLLKEEKDKNDRKIAEKDRKIEEMQKMLDQLTLAGKKKGGKK